MRILIVSFLFPPYNAIGAVRVGKMAKYLIREGHDVRVLTAAKQPFPTTLPIEIDVDRVVYTPWLSLNRIPRQAFKAVFLRDAADIEVLGPEAASRTSKHLIALGRVYRSLFNFPDEQLGWYPNAVRQGRSLISNWRPDVIFASAMPYTSLLVGARLGAIFGIPWVGELRDLWSQYNYKVSGPVRNAADRWLERRTLRRAAGLVTVSDPLADSLRADYEIPVCTILNGFDREDFLGVGEAPADSQELRIVYTGKIYEGKRDPSPLFQALCRMGSDAENIRVEFYGAQLDLVPSLAQSYHVGHLVSAYPKISYMESLAKQRSADILLLLLWNDASEKGVFTGKLFEYIGTGRPILALGHEDNVAAQLIKNRNLGYVEQRPEEIEQILRRWLKTKEIDGAIPGLPVSDIDGFTREAQARKLSGFLGEVLQGTRD